MKLLLENWRKYLKETKGLPATVVMPKFMTTKEIEDRLEELESEKRWDEAFEKSPDVLEALANEALAEYQSGRTQELDP